MILPRATALVPGTEAPERLTLDSEDRWRRRGRMETDDGRAFMLDLPQVTELAEGWLLSLDDGSKVALRAAPEPLMEAAATDPLHLARLAWHVGNRHLPAELHETRLVLRRDPVIADMLRHLGATLREIEAPFSPEGGAYGHGRTHGHEHD